MANKAEGITKDEEKNRDAEKVAKVDEAMEDTDTKAATHNNEPEEVNPVNNHLRRRRTMRRVNVETIEKEE